MELMMEEWETWKTEHGKTYGGHSLLGSTGNSLGGPSKFTQTEHFRWLSKELIHNRFLLHQ